MIERIFGWVLFTWMVASLYGLIFGSTAPPLAGPTGTATTLGIGVFMASLAGVGLMMGLGKRLQLRGVRPPDAS